MIRELASVGAVYKIVTNLIMLPLLASYFRFDAAYVARVERLRRARDGLMIRFVWQSQGRHISHVLPGAPELRSDSRYNQNVQGVVDHFALGLNLFTVAVKTPAGGCYQHDVMRTWTV